MTDFFKPNVTAVASTPTQATYHESSQGKALSLTESINFLNKLEGYKTKIKNFHWSARTLVQRGYLAEPIHVRLDELLDEVSEFQDSIAEGSMGLFGDIPLNTIEGTSCMCIDPIDLLDTMCVSVLEFYDLLKDNEYMGLRADTESFFNRLKVHRYLATLSKIN